MEPDWNLCVICDMSGTDLKCPADSHQKNGLEVFLQVVEEFCVLETLPVNVDYKGENSSIIFTKSGFNGIKPAISNLIHQNVCMLESSGTRNAAK